MTDETESLVQQALDMSNDLLRQHHRPSVAPSFSEGDDEAGEDNDDDDDDDGTDEARRYSQMASQYLQRNQLDASLAAYARAAAAYQEHNAESILSSVNTAGCYRNMGAVCRRLGEFELAIVHLRTAEGWYKRAEASVAPYSPSLLSSSTESLCLNLLLIETMQSRATFHFRNPGELEEAIKCHEECLTRLLDSTTSRDGAEMERVHFLPLSEDQETELLVVSVENLSGMYRMDPNLATTERMNQLEQGIGVLRIRRSQARADDVKNHAGAVEKEDKLLLPLTQSLRYLSEIYLEKGQMDKAVDSMQDAMDVELASSTNPSAEALDAMDKLGTVNEDLGNYDKALTCYEKAMFARSRMYGDEHVGVGKDLINVARIMELYGNTEGSLDLYKAAHDIYSKWLASEHFHCEKEDAEAMLHLIPNLFAQHRFEEARSFLVKCLEVAEEQSDDDETFDKSQMYFDLGQASIGMGDFVSATIFLMEAAKFEGTPSGDGALLLLDRLESLQKGRHGHRSGIRTTQSWGAGEVPSRSRRTSRSRTPKRDSSVPSRIIHTTTSTAGEKMLPAVVTPEGDLGTSNYLSSGSTIPTLDASDNDHWPLTKRLFDSPDSTETSSRFVQQKDLGEESILDATENDDKSDFGDDRNQKLAPLLSPSATIYSDDAMDLNPSPVSSEGRSIKKNRSVLPWNSGSPKRPKDDRSIGSQQFTSISKVFGGGLVRRRKQGFQSLPEQAMNDSEEFDETNLPATNEVEGSDGIEVGLQDGIDADDGIGLHNDDDEEEVTEAASEMGSNDGPCLIIQVDKCQDDLSEITMKFDTPKTAEELSTGTNNQEWWWGVTSEGFGRWFPSSYVSQAVQAADNFLSAKAIHSKSRHVPAAAQALASLSDDESEDEVSLERGDFASNVGVGSMARMGVNEPYKAKHRHGQHSSYLQPPLDSDRDVTSDILLHKELLVSQRKDSGDSHPSVATTLFMLAVLHSRDSDVKSAMNCAAEALSIQQSNGNHEDAARSLHFLGDLNLHQKKYQQSLNQYEKALRHETICFGFYSDATAKTRNCIGTVKLLQNKFSEAMESHEEALKILKECHGEDLKHPLVSETLCQIGSVYYRERNALSKESSGDDYTTFIEMGMLEVIGQAHEDRGSYRMAISFYEEKLHLLESKPKSNETSAQIATTLNGLGMLSSRAGLYSEALEYYGKAVRLQHKLGCSEVDLAAAQVLTGAVHFLLGRWDTSLRQLKDARNVLEKNLGAMHETVAAAHYQLGLVQAAYCDYDSAMKSLGEALDIQSELLGQEHPATLRTRREIGNLYAVYEAELDSAFENFHFVLDVQKRIHGDRHPNLAETLQSIGAAHARRREFTEALRALEDCYYMRVEFLGWDHPLQATTLHDIAKIQLQRGRIKKASQICQIIMTIRQDSLSERHIDVAKTRLTQGKCLVAQGETDEATLCLMEALAIAEEKLGSSHPLVAEVHTEIGGLYLRKCQFDLARESIQKALDIYIASHLDEDYFGVQEAREKMRCVERDEMLCV